MLKRMHDERGSMLAISAVLLAVLIVLGTLAVDVGNWFTHKRHLQTQADAAALAAGAVWQVNCDGTVNQAIIDTARQYAGPSAAGNTGPYNPQFGGTPPANLHVLLNSLNTYDNGGTDFSDDQPCVTSARPDQATYDPFAPLNEQNYITDVKLTEKNLPWFFNLAGLGLIPSINAEARVKATSVQGERGFVPIGVQLPKIYSAQATIKTCNGTALTSPVEIPLVRVGPDNTVPGASIWTPDPNNGGNVSVIEPNFGTNQCSGTDYEGINVNVHVSGSPNVTPTLSNCGNRYVDCFDTTRLRVYTSGATQKVQFRSVNLADVDCGPGTPYWASGNATPTLPCRFSATADVQWGDRLGAGFTATLTAHGGSGTSATVNNVTTSGVFAFGGLKTDDGNGSPNTPTDIDIDWDWARTSGTWRGATCKASGNNPCKGDGTTTVHRANVVDTSPVVKVVVSNGGLPLDSFDKDVFPPQFNLSVSIQDGGFRVGQKSVLRTTKSQGSEALDCNDANNGQVFQQFEYGCTPFYARNDFSPGIWEPCPSASSFPANPPAWRCVPQLPGKHGQQIVPDGFDAATKNCDKVNGGDNQCLVASCNNANQYVYGDPLHTYDLSDPRIIKLFLIPYAGLNGITGNGVIEVADFAAYYVTGWQGDPCKNTTMGGTDEVVPNGADAVGYFVKLVDPTAVPDPNSHCVATDTTPCIVTLVR